MNMTGTFSGVTLTLGLTDFTTWLSEQLTDIATSGELIQVRSEKYVVLMKFIRIMACMQG